MKNFEIVLQEELQNIKGGENEMNDVSMCEDILV
jgi:hypothetical protein